MKHSQPFNGTTLKVPNVRYWTLLISFVFLIGVVSLAMIFWSDKLRDRSEDDALLSSAVMDLQVEVSIFHLWFEKFLSGDESVDMVLTVNKLREAERLVKAMLTGGMTMHGRIDHPVADSEIKAKCDVILSLLTQLKSLALQRVFAVENSDISSRLDMNFNKVFEELIIESKSLEGIFVRKTVENRAGRDWAYQAIFAAWALLLVSSLLGLHIMGRRVRSSIRKVKESESRLHSIVQSARDAMITINKHGEIVLWNEAASKLFGYSADEVYGRNITVIMPQRFREAHNRGLSRSIDKGVGEHAGAINLSGLRKDRTDVSLELSLSSWSMDGEIFFTSIIRDTTYREKIVRLEKLAETDALTEAYNRARFNELIQSEMERNKRFAHPLSMLLFDIDDFKAINDTYGHLAGDEVLKTISDIVRKQIRSTNYFFRWGGEEFIILAVVTDIEGGVALAERIRSAIDSYVFDSVGGVTVSFGVTQYVTGEPESSFLKRTDEALYIAKSAGKNRVERLIGEQRKDGNAITVNS